MPRNVRFAGYPAAVVFANPDGTKPVQQLLWGDWLRLKRGRQGDFVEVRARGHDGWMHKDTIQKERLLEIVFVDIGQGDGCLVVTPDDKHMVIDAGEGDNMARFLRWRYGGFEDPWEFECGVISHPDQDHYRGFEGIFDIDNVTFGTIYHNGIVERSAKKDLGPTRKVGGRTFLTGVIRDEAALRELLSSARRRGRKRYPNMLHEAQQNRKFKRFRMLSSADGHMPGYGPDEDLSIEVLGPIPEGPPDRPMLRSLGSKGKTKNGHSLVLRLEYRDVRILLGGDLNIPAENFLLGHHTGLRAPARTPEEHAALVEAARAIFEVDVAKSCHHGSADFSATFLSALNPIATVISSGDNEPHAHPRADTLGTIGAHGRGARPLIFSTELSRSAPEAVKHPHILRSRIRDLQKRIDAAEDGSREEKRLQKQFDKIVSSLDRSVAVYGAINVRTDGRKVVFAYKIERPRSKASKWDIYKLEPHGGVLQYISKH